MKASDLRERSVEDLRELEKSIAKDQFQARFKNFTNRLDDTSAIAKAKRDLARVKTILREKALLAAPTAATPAAAEKKAPAKKAPAKKTTKKSEAK
jgi:large subunit ribosomal protein L29